MGPLLHLSQEERYVYISHKATRGLNFVSDCRLKSDADIDHEEGGTHVLELLKLGREVLGAAKYVNSSRIALFDYRGAETATAEERASARKALRTHLAKLHVPRVTVLIPTCDMSEDGDAQKAETVCWGAFGAPDSLASMRGCAFEWTKNRYVIPVYPPSGALKELQKWEQSQWVCRAVQLATSIERNLVHDILRPYHLVSEMDVNNGSQMQKALEGLKTSVRGLAVDIESIEATGTITAIGISDGIYAVSVPWESFRPHGAREPEKGIFDYRNGDAVAMEIQRLLASNQGKVFHNHTFDVPRLQEKGFCINGRIDDSFAASAIAAPELKHGLQATAATFVTRCIPPWKSMWHPKLKGISRDDIEYWTCDPKALRDYNARDAFYTWHLADAVLPHVGRTWAA